MTRLNFLQLLHTGAVIFVSGVAWGAAIQTAALSPKRIEKIGREELAKRRESYQPGGDAKPGALFQEKGR